MRNPEEDSIENLLRLISDNVSNFKVLPECLSEIREMFQNQDLIDILAILKNKELMFAYIKNCEKLDSEINLKTQKILEKENSIRNLEDELNELRKKVNETTSKMVEVNKYIQNELEKSFKAKFLVMN